MSHHYAGPDFGFPHRSGRPAQVVFLVGDQRAAYLTAEPADDARFIPVFAHSLEHAGGYTQEQARGVVATRLPDIMRFDPALPALACNLLTEAFISPWALACRRHPRQK